MHAGTDGFNVYIYDFKIGKHLLNEVL